MEFGTNQNTFETTQMTSITLSIMLKVSASMIKALFLLHFGHGTLLIICDVTLGFLATWRDGMTDKIEALNIQHAQMNCHGGNDLMARRNMTEEICLFCLWLCYF